MKPPSAILARSIAGLIAPMAAALIWSLSTGLYGFDVSLFGLALILGAPFSVPVALLLAPQRVWLVLAPVSLVAAVGIELQLDALFAGGQIAEPLMFLWIVPAAFGAGAAWFLRRRRTIVAHVAIAITGALALSAISIHNRPAAEDPSYAASARKWSELRPGMKVYIGGDSGASTQTVCPDLDSYLRYEQTNNSTNCAHIAHGVPVVIDSIIPCTKSDPNYGYETPRARIHAVDGSWHGVTTADVFQPNIPIGTILRLERDWGAPLNMVREGKRVDLGGEAKVSLVRYDPKADDGGTLYVRILDGKYAGEEGWTGIQDVDSGDVALGGYAMAYPMQDCGY